LGSELERVAGAVKVEGAGFRTLLAPYPVRQAEFEAFARAVGLVWRHGREASERPNAPVTRVSRTNAIAYCEWRTAREGVAFRLPAMAELNALVIALGAAEADPEMWSEENRHTAGLVGGLKAHYLCEWTRETEEIERRGEPPRVLGSIFYPPWMREGQNHTHAQAHLLASDGYSFVTFRLARTE
jgi:formylglycine-generating enzyme required for sulfatase activity